MKTGFCRLTKALASLSLVVGAVTVAGWSMGLAQTRQSTDEPVQPAIHAVMVNVINPAANTVWDRAYANKLSEQDWERVKDAVTKLAGTMPLVSRGGPSINERGNVPQWKEWAEKFSDTVLAAKHAADTRNHTALGAAGDTLVEVCEGCHLAVAAAAS